jgi:hypothetical protein
MTNIIEFKPKQRAPEIEPAEDKSYWIQDIQFAANYAAFVHRDTEAVEMLVDQIKACLVSAQAVCHLPLAVRIRCASYLLSGDALGQATKDYYVSLYKPFSPPSQQ